MNRPMEQEREAFEAWRLEKFCGGTERLRKCSNAPDVYYFTAEQEAWKVWQARAALTASPAQPEQPEQQPELTVWEGAMPESNGKSNFTAVLMRKGADLFDGISGGMTIARSECPDRVRYEADCVRWLIGELAKEPCIIDYDADKHSGYAAPIAQTDPWAPSGADYDRAIHHNPDAKAWADLFVETFPGLADKHDLMIGWFANAMMAMHDHLARKPAPQPEQSGLVAALEQFADDSNWCYDTCNISRDVAKDALASYRSTQGGDA